MPNFSFKKEVKVFLVHSGAQYRIDVSEIDFGQTFQEKSFEVKTLHNQSSFEGSVINQANAAEFSFNTPLLKEERHKVVFDRLLDCTTFDLYISSGQDVFKLEKCVIQDGTFEINRSRPLRLSISGEASKLSNYTPAGASIAATAITGKYVYITSLGNTDFTAAGAAENKVGHIFTATQNLSGTGTVVEVIPGTLQTTGTSTTTYIIPALSTFTIGSDDVSDSIISMSVEIQNDINWNNYTTIQGATTATNAATSMYPSNFTIGKRVLAGTIAKYLKSDSTSVLTWNTNTALRLKAGDDVGKTVVSVAIAAGGSGYQNAPAVTITGGGGSGATVTSTISGGAVNGLIITNPGSGYTSTPTLTIAQPQFGGSGQQATGTATLSAESVVYGVDFNITNCSFTNRMSTADVFREEYNWRMTQNPTALSSVITYTTA